MIVFGINRRRFKSYLRPVGVKLLGQQHGQGSVNTLSHLGVVHDDRHPFIGPYTHKSVGHELARGCLRRRADSGKVKSNEQAATGGDRKFQKVAAGHAAPRTLELAWLAVHCPPALTTMPAAR